MGGRGGSAGGKVKGLVINTGKTTLSYREHNGTITDMNKTSIKNTNGLTLSQLKSRAKSQGWEVKTYNSKQLKQYDEKYKLSRKAASKQLDNMLAKARTTERVHRGK